MIKKPIRDIPLDDNVVTNAEFKINAILTSGVKIAEIITDENTTEIYAPSADLDVSEISATISKNYISCNQIVSVLGDSHTLVPDQWLITQLSAYFTNHKHHISDLYGYQSEEWKFKLENQTDYIVKNIFLTEDSDVYRTQLNNL